MIVSQKEFDTQRGRKRRRTQRTRWISSAATGVMIVLIVGCCETRTEFLSTFVNAADKDRSFNHRDDRHRSVILLKSLESLRISDFPKRRRSFSIRGGADYYDDSFTANNIESKKKIENHEKIDNGVDDGSSEHVNLNHNDSPNKGKSVLSWLFGDLFLNDGNVMIGQTIPDESTLKASPSSLLPAQITGSNVTQSTGRGGALVKHKQTFRNRFLPPWLKQPLFDIHRVAPFASRLFRDDDIDTFIDSELDDDSSSGRTITDKIKSWGSSNQDHTVSSSTATSTVTKRIAESVAASATSVSKVWWVDTWADHLPDDDDIDGLSDNNRIEQLEGDTSNEQLDHEYYDVAIVDKDNNRRVSSYDDHSHTNISTVGDEVVVAKVPQRDNDKNLSIYVNTSLPYELVVPGNDKVNETTLALSLNRSVFDPLFHSSQNQAEGQYTSSGSWRTIDRVVTLGYADTHPDWRISARLRKVRKISASITGLHGFLSGKPTSSKEQQANVTDLEDPKMGLIGRRLAAIERARQNIERITLKQSASKGRKFPFWNRNIRDEANEPLQHEFTRHKSEKERMEERKRNRRVKEIDHLIQDAQKHLIQLTSEKDLLQQRPNPLWNYTANVTEFVEFTTTNINNETQTNSSISSSVRTFNFPSPDLVDEYLETLFITGRLTRMNQTEIWRQSNDDDDEDDEDVDEFSMASVMTPQQQQYRRNNNNQNNAAPWLLRNILGEKLGEAVEMAAYKAVCTSLMTLLAKAISNMHGVNVMGYSDIRLYVEETPHLSPTTTPVDVPTGANKNRNYAQEAFQDVLRRGSTISSTKRNIPYRNRESTFIQREAIVETLTSQCQIAAPLLNMFPLSLQRALISNIVIMSTAILTDFFEGLEFHILGHRLSFLFQPITEEEMMRNMIRDDYNSHHQSHNDDRNSRASSDLFEAAVRATAEEVGENLHIFDRWHERALGSGVLRTQIATIIARLVLTLIDDILRASRMDLWSSHAGGPKLSAALEYRTVMPANIFGI